MKLFTSILLFTLLFSCTEKKHKQEIKTIDNQNVETVKKTTSTHTDATSIKETKVSVKQNSQVKKKHTEIPPDGTYIYDIAYAEWQGKSMGEKVKVVIKGNTIKIISEGNPSMTAKKGEVLDEGTLIKHNKTGEWLISNNPSDANLEAYGGCVGAPMVVDFVNKKYITC